MATKKQTKEKTTNKSQQAGRSQNTVALHSETCNDKNCPIHGKLRLRGRTFKGVVIKKLDKRIVIQFERVIYVRKFERYKKTETKIHARLPDCMKKEVEVGDLVKIQECRPLSKIIHFVFLEKIKDAEEKK